MTLHKIKDVTSISVDVTTVPKQGNKNKFWVTFNVNLNNKDNPTNCTITCWSKTEVSPLLLKANNLYPGCRVEISDTTLYQNSFMSRGKEQTNYVINLNNFAQLSIKWQPRQKTTKAKVKLKSANP